jgi:hypothetical protein
VIRNEELTGHQQPKCGVDESGGECKCAEMSVIVVECSEYCSLALADA